jgi:hypothetical protein
MSDFWFYKKKFKDYINKARLWDLMTTYKKQEKTQTRLELATKEKTQRCWSIICKKKVHNDTHVKMHKVKQRRRMW